MSGIHSGQLPEPAVREQALNRAQGEDADGKLGRVEGEALRLPAAPIYVLPIDATDEPFIIADLANTASDGVAPLRRRSGTRV